MFKFWGRGTLNKNSYREAQPRGPTRYPFISRFDRKRGRQFGILIGLGSRKTPNFLIVTTFLKTMELTIVLWISIPFLTQWTHFTLVLNFCSCKIKPLRVPYDIVWHYVLPYVQLTFEEAWLTQVLVSERLDIQLSQTLYFNTRGSEMSDM